MSESTFKEIYKVLSKVDISGHVEKKDKFKYLSWVFAFDTLSKLYDWHHEDPEIVNIGDSIMIKTVVVVEGVSRRMHLAVTNFSNKALVDPKCADVANTIMRCLVKNIAVFGLGFNLYAGEDIPIGDDNKIQPPKPPEVDVLPTIDPKEVGKMLDIATQKYQDEDIATILAWLDSTPKAKEFLIARNMIESELWDMDYDVICRLKKQTARDALTKNINGNKQTGETK